MTVLNKRVLIGLGLLWGVACSDETRPSKSPSTAYGGQTNAAGLGTPAASSMLIAR